MRQKAKRTEKERLERIKNKEKNRKRPNTVAFRMSDEEKRLFEDRVTMSGLLKQDFIIQSLLFSDVQFRGSNITIKRIEERLDANRFMYNNLCRRVAAILIHKEIYSPGNYFL